MTEKEILEDALSVAQATFPALHWKLGDFARIRAYVTDDACLILGRAGVTNWYVETPNSIERCWGVDALEACQTARAWMVRERDWLIAALAEGNT